MDNKISFGAKPLFRTKISKLKRNDNLYKVCPATFAEIDAANSDDIKAINTLAEKWGDEAKYIKAIATATNWMNLKNHRNIRVFVLTLQKNNYEKLCPCGIIGCTTARDGNKKSTILQHLQIMPLAINVGNNKSPSLKGSGTAIIKSLKRIYNKIKLTSDDNPLIRRFYRRNGFKENVFIENRFSWSIGLIGRINRFLNSILNNKKESF